MTRPARRAVGLLALTAAATAIGIGVACMDRSAVDGGIVLVISQEAPDATVAPGGERSEIRQAAASLAVATMTEESAAALAKEIHRWRVLVDIAHNPLSVDLEEDDLGKRMKSTYGELSPRLTAAASLLGGTWQADDGLTVRVARACPRGGQWQCVDPSAEPTDDRTAARARFLAWPLADAVHLRTAHDQAKAVADNLRRIAEGVGSNSAIALIVEGESLRASSAAVKHVQAEALGLTKALGSRAPAEQRALARSFSGGTSPESVAPWLARRDEVLLVPKLAYVGRLPELVAEVRRLLAQLNEPSVSLVEPTFVGDPR